MNKKVVNWLIKNKLEKDYENRCYEGNMCKGSQVYSCGCGDFYPCKNWLLYAPANFTTNVFLKQFHDFGEFEYSVLKHQGDKRRIRK